MFWNKKPKSSRQNLIFNGKSCCRLGPHCPLRFAKRGEGVRKSIRAQASKRKHESTWRFQEFVSFLCNMPCVSCQVVARVAKRIPQKGEDKYRNGHLAWGQIVQRSEWSRAWAFGPGQYIFTNPYSCFNQQFVVPSIWMSSSIVQVLLKDPGYSCFD